MVSLKFVGFRPNNSYILKDIKTNKNYSLKFEFYGVDRPKLGDIIVLNEVLLDRNSEYFAQPFAFASFNEKEEKVTDNKDLAGFYSNGKKFILRRIYG